jgi:hypothetical protein
MSFQTGQIYLLRRIFVPQIGTSSAQKSMIRQNVLTVERPMGIPDWLNDWPFILCDRHWPYMMRTQINLDEFRQVSVSIGVKQLLLSSRVIFVPQCIPSRFKRLGIWRDYPRTVRFHAEIC